MSLGPKLPTDDPKMISLVSLINELNDRLSEVGEDDRVYIIGMINFCHLCGLEGEGSCTCWRDE